MLMIIVWLLSLGCLICAIIVLIKLFQTEGALKGILGIICLLYTFIWGWMNANKLNLKNIMMIWTLLLILSIIINVMFGAFYAMPTSMPTNAP